MTLTLQSCITQLTRLAADHEAQLTTMVQLQLGGGAILVIHWCGHDEPREAHVLFGCGLTDGTARDAWQAAFVYDVDRFLWSIDEGLSDSDAEDYSRRVVDDYENLAAYLLGRIYTYTGA